MEVQVLLLAFVGTCKPLAPSEPTGWPGKQWNIWTPDTGHWSLETGHVGSPGKWPFVIYLTLLKSIPLFCSLISHAALNAIQAASSLAKVQIAYGKWSWIARELGQMLFHYHCYSSNCLAHTLTYIHFFCVCYFFAVFSITLVILYYWNCKPQIVIIAHYTANELCTAADSHEICLPVVIWYLRKN